MCDYSEYSEYLVHILLHPPAHHLSYCTYILVPLSKWSGEICRSYQKLLLHPVHPWRLWDIWHQSKGLKSVFLTGTMKTWSLSIRYHVIPYHKAIGLTSGQECTVVDCFHALTAAGPTDSSRWCCSSLCFLWVKLLFKLQKHAWQSFGKSGHMANLTETLSSLPNHCYIIFCIWAHLLCLVL